MGTPLPQLVLALEGVVEFERWRNGAPLDTTRPPADTPAPAAAAKALFGFLRGKAAAPDR